MTTPRQSPLGPQPDPMGPDPDPYPDPDPIPVPNPAPEPAAPVPEEPGDRDVLGDPECLGRGPRLVRHLAIGALLAGGAIAACFNEVPGPQGPLPSPMREVPKQGPKPEPIMPAPHIIGKPSLDAGVPMMSMSQGAAARPMRLTIPIGATSMSDIPTSDPPPPTQPPEQNPPAPAPSDAGVVDSSADLPPEMPDAGPIATPDAGQPLRR